MRRGRRKGDSRSDSQQACGKRPLGITVVPSVESIDIDAWLDRYVRAIAVQQSSSLAA